ncbi:MAG: rhodanese-like domain-containing protein [Buchnera aphidicola (Chaetogeoica yunlongensis)]
MLDIILKFFYDHMFLSVSWCISLLLMLFFVVKDMFFNVKFITALELISFINTKKTILIIDARDSKKFSSGRIINSINISYDHVKSDFYVKKLKEYINFPVILVFENNSEINKNYVYFIRSIGCQDIYVLKHGMVGWLSNDNPVVLSTDD